MICPLAADTLEYPVNTLRIDESINALSAIFSQSSVGLLVADPISKRIYYANAAVWQLFRAAPSEQAYLADLGIDESTLTDLNAQFSNEPSDRHQSVIPCQSWQCEQSIQFDDGASLIVELHWSVLQTNAGQAILAIIRDVTADKQLHDHVVEREYQLRIALEASGHCLFDLDAKHRVFKFSAEYVQMLGDETAELNESLQYWSERVHPEDRLRVLSELEQCLEGQLPKFHSEFRQRAVDGKWLWVLANGNVVANDLAGKPARMLGIFTQITRQRELGDKLHKERQLLKSLLDNIPDLVWLKDPGGKYLAGNNRFQEMYGVTEAQLLGRKDSDFVSKKQANFFRSCDLKAMTSKVPYVFEEWVTFAGDGHQALLETSKVALFDEDQTLIGVLGIGHDITERKAMEARLERAASVFSSALEGIMITDLLGNILDVNASFCRITGYEVSEVLGQNARMLSSGQHDELFYQQMWQALLQQGYWAGEIWNRRKNGELFPEMLHISLLRDKSQQPNAYLALFSDISRVKAQQQQLEHNAHFDALTGLPNRVLLVDRLQQALLYTRRHQQTVAVAFLDLDGFKAINDRYGHECGDLLLIALSARLSEVLRAGDTIARLGGDEFVAVLSQLQHPSASQPILERLLEAAAAPIVVQDHEMQVSASIGVTFVPQPQEVDADLLLRQADQAMYQAKLAGKNRICRFDPLHDSTARHRFLRIEALDKAITDGQLLLYFQPKVHLGNGSLLGFEALARWQDPVHGFLVPADFIGLLHQHPIAIRFGDWAIATALAQLEVWRQQGLITAVSVNIDVMQLFAADFADNLLAKLHQYPELRPWQLELEIVETGALDNLRQVSRLIARLQSAGIRVALDDFGTGYSSLTFIKQLPTHAIKIDQSFVGQMLVDAEQLVIIDSVIGLADSLGRQLIAEGVESVAHGKLLLELGCTFGQGFGIAKPMPGEQVTAWIQQWQIPAEWAQHQSGLPVNLLIAEIELRTSMVTNQPDPQRMLGFLQSLQPHASGKQSRAIEALKKLLNELAGRAVPNQPLLAKEDITEPAASTIVPQPDILSAVLTEIRQLSLQIYPQHSGRR